MKKNVNILLLILIACSLQAVKKIAIIGTGYVGLVGGAGLAEFGNTVVCADIDAKKIALLNNGEIPIYEPGLTELVEKHTKTGRLTFTTNVAEAIQDAKVIFIAVGTPKDSTDIADLRCVHAVIKTISENMNGYKVICMKSTVPIGLGNEIIQTLQEHGVDRTLFDYVSNPEFLREGSAVYDFLEPDRTVIGCETIRAKDIMCDIYSALTKKNIPYVITNIPTAETIKYACNTFLATKITFINELANLCDATGADVAVVAKTMGLDKRISPKFMQPGPGFGGSCFPKDSVAMQRIGIQHGIDLKIIDATLKANEEQKRVPVKKLQQYIPDLNGKTIALLGLAFKANTDDIRYSPAITTIEILHEQGAHIKAYDPQAMENMRQLFPDITYCDSAYEAATNADAIIIMTEWAEFKQLDFSELAELVNNRLIIDARNMLDQNTPKTRSKRSRYSHFIIDNIGRSALFNVVISNTM